MKQESSNKKNKGIRALFGMMGLCCILPIIIVFILPVIGLGESRLLRFISPILCPIFMMIMMVFMFKDSSGHNCCSQKKGLEKE